MNKKIKHYKITNGHIVATWHILYLVQQYNGIHVRDAINIVKMSGKLGGTVPAKQGIKICNDYGFIRFKNQELHLTEFCELNIITKCNYEDPNKDVTRAILFHILSYHNFEWLILFDSDSEIFKANLVDTDPEWANLLDNAYLFDFEDIDVISWWDKLLAKYENYKSDIKKAIGDVGERLTYKHEIKRIDLDGIIKPKTYVKWASILSDRFGFDIQSIRGKYFLSHFSEYDKIQIEVKSSDNDNPERFRFFISKPEWIKATEYIDSYFFFCWTGINIDDESAKHGPFIIPAKDLIDDVPIDNSNFCEWSECRCVLDIIKYKFTSETLL